MTHCEVFIYDKFVAALDDGTFIIDRILGQVRRKAGIEIPQDDMAMSIESEDGSSATLLTSWTAGSIYIHDGQVRLWDAAAHDTIFNGVKRIVLRIPQANMPMAPISVPEGHLTLVCYFSELEHVDRVPTDALWARPADISRLDAVRVQVYSELPSLVADLERISGMTQGLRVVQKSLFWHQGSQILRLVGSGGVDAAELLRIRPVDSRILFLRCSITRAESPVARQQKERAFRASTFVHPGTDVHAPVYLLEYLAHVKQHFRKVQKKHHLACAMFVQSRGTGKSRATTECLKVHPGAYLCFRGEGDFGWPRMNSWSGMLLRYLRTVDNAAGEDRIVTFTAKYLLALMSTVRCLRKSNRGGLTVLHGYQLSDVEGEQPLDEVSFFAWFEAFLHVLAPTFRPPSTPRSHLADAAESFLLETILEPSRMETLLPQYVARGHRGGLNFHTTLPQIVATCIDYEFLALFCYALVTDESSSEQDLFLLVVDEVQYLMGQAPGLPEGSPVPFEYLQKALLAFRYCPVLTLLLGTQAVARDLVRFQVRYLELSTPLPPIIPLEYFDIFPESKAIFDAGTLFKAFSKECRSAEFRDYATHLTRLGRPAWSTAPFPAVVQQVIEMFGFEVDSRAMLSKPGWIALFSAAVGISITPATTLASTLVRSWMAWLLSVDAATFSESYCAYTSEPVMAVAACCCLFWPGMDESKFAAAVQAIKSYVATGELDKGEIGEFVCRLLLVAAMQSRSAITGPREGWDFGALPARISLEQLLLNLFGCELGSAPDWLELVLAHIRQEYRSAWVSFSHFTFTYIKSEDFGLSRDLLLQAMTRNAAIMTPMRFPGLDAVIPYVARARNGEFRVGYVGVQFKNLATPSMHAPWKISTGMFSNRQVGEGVDNIVNLTMQVGSVDASEQALSLGSQVHVPNREIPPQDAAFRCLHWSRSVVVMELQPTWLPAWKAPFRITFMQTGFPSSHPPYHQCRLRLRRTSLQFCLQSRITSSSFSRIAPGRLTFTAPSGT